MKRQTKPILITALFAVATLTLTACNTVQGVGQDIESVGKGIEKGSKDVRRKF